MIESLVVYHMQEFCTTCTPDDSTQAAAPANNTRRMLYTSGNALPFPYGPAASDVFLQRCDDCSSTLNLVQPITIYGTACSSLSMNNNGETSLLTLCVTL
jgi:hypothetical protein